VARLAETHATGTARKIIIRLPIVYTQYTGAITDIGTCEIHKTYRNYGDTSSPSYYRNSSYDIAHTAGRTSSPEPDARSGDGSKSYRYGSTANQHRIKQQKRKVENMVVCACTKTNKIAGPSQIASRRAPAVNRMARSSQSETRSPRVNRNQDERRTAPGSPHPRTAGRAAKDAPPAKNTRQSVVQLCNCAVGCARSLPLRRYWRCSI
jgi:hypothetical protein